MSWNYRICRHVEAGQTLFSLREVYYADAGEPRGWTSASVDNWETLTDIKGTLDLMRGALEQPVLDLPEV